MKETGEERGIGETVRKEGGETAREMGGGKR